MNTFEYIVYFSTPIVPHLPITKLHKAVSIHAQSRQEADVLALREISSIRSSQVKNDGKFTELHTVEFRGEHKTEHTSGNPYRSSPVSINDVFAEDFSSVVELKAEIEELRKQFEQLKHQFDVDLAQWFSVRQGG